jgi:hypothetical protein
MREVSMPRGITTAGIEPTAAHAAFAAMSLKSIPWKTVALVVVVSLIVIAAVKRNFLGLGNLTSPSTPAA